MSEEKRQVRRRTLPRYVHAFTDRHGKARHYFRRKGSKSVALPGRPGTVAFDRAYEAALAGQPLVVARARPKPQLKAPTETAQYADKAGVYLLLQADEVVYVGSSLKMGRRVTEHRTNGRPFDRARYIVTMPNERFLLEKILIAAMKPRQNKSGGIANTDLQIPGPDLANRA